MNHKNWWLTVILISSVQLILLLVSVVALFSWMERNTEEQMGFQTCFENSVIGSRLAKEIGIASVRDIRNQNSADQSKLASILHDDNFSLGAVAWVLDRKTGQQLSKLSSSSPAETFEKISLMSVNGEESLGLLTHCVSVDRRKANGRIQVKANNYFVNIQYLPQLDALLVIGQPASMASQRMSNLMGRAKQVTSLVTLMIGMLGTCLTVVILTRVSQKVTHLNDGLEKQVSSSARELVRTKNAVIFGLAKLAESRDNDTGEHLDRIRAYVTILADDIAQHNPEFDEQFLHNLALASSLHDIGKVGIPDSILLKPGRLTPEERGVMELHTLIGGECLDAIHARLGENAFMHIARQIAYYHHEKWDGSGYPHSLKEDEIPLVARIVAVADVYDALTSKRPYKNAMSHMESKAIIVSGTGQHFDPEIVDAFLRHEDEFEAISLHQQFLSDADATSEFQRLCQTVDNQYETKSETAGLKQAQV